MDKLLTHNTDNPLASRDATLQGGPQQTKRWPSTSQRKRNRVDPGLVPLKSSYRIRLRLYCKNTPRLSQDNQQGHQKHFSRPSRRIRFLPLPWAEPYNVNVHQTVENEGCATATHNVKVRPSPQSVTVLGKERVYPERIQNHRKALVSALTLPY